MNQRMNVVYREQHKVKNLKKIGRKFTHCKVADCPNSGIQVYYFNIFTFEDYFN